MRNPMRSLSLSMLLLFLTTALPAEAQNQPIRAVFFDLGDTLVENAGGTFVLRPGAAEVVSRLQALGTQLGIITNVPSDWTLEDLEAVLEEPEFLQEFDPVVLSSQAPASKPDPAIYTFAHDQLPVVVPITETAFVGETLAEIANDELSPTSGARSVGMIGIHLSDAPPSPLADFTVPSDDLPAIAELVATVFTDGFETGDTEAWSATSP